MLYTNCKTALNEFLTEAVIDAMNMRLPEGEFIWGSYFNDELRFNDATYDTGIYEGYFEDYVYENFPQDQMHLYRSTWHVSGRTFTLEWDGGGNYEPMYVRVVLPTQKLMDEFIKTNYQIANCVVITRYLSNRVAALKKDLNLTASYYNVYDEVSGKEFITIDDLEKIYDKIEFTSQ